MSTLSDHEVERALGYTPCVCGVIDGTWHDRCYRGKTKAQITAGYKLAFAAARLHLQAKAARAQAPIARPAHEPPHRPIKEAK